MSDRLYTRAHEGLAVVVSALTTAGVPSPARVQVTAGEPALDECCNGWLSAWPSGLYMTLPFPDEALFSPGGCAADERVAEFTFQYAMCVPTLGDGVSPLPTADDLDAAGEQGALAMLALHRGLACWVGMLREDDTDAMLTGRVEPDPSEGACASWRGTVVLVVDGCGCPEGTLD